MSKRTKITWTLFALTLLPAAGGAQFGSPCEVADNGTGTVNLPPDGCAYLSPAQVHMIIDGLPPGTTIELDPIHLAFFCRNPARDEACIVEPGGGLGGQLEIFDSALTFELRGTGALAGFHRVLAIDTHAQTHTGPRVPGAPVQTFPTDMFILQGQLTGDPDFADLVVVGGTGFGLPSPGQTTLTRLPNGDFNVDSFFDISYQIAFLGAVGGPLEGMNGVTAGTIRMEVEGAKEKKRCIEPDAGGGTVVLPPPGCDYLTPEEVHAIIDGLPPGTEIELDARHTRFICQTDPCGQPGGNLGGEVEVFDSEVVIHLTGNNALADFRRTVRVPLAAETHTGPRNPGDPVQSFPTDMFRLQGSLPPGDPDFESLTVTGGTANGFPSPGQTVVEHRPDGKFNVDSFFDIHYEIDFVGAPGGALAGMRGTTPGRARVVARKKKQEAIEPAVPIAGTVELPPKGSQYVSPVELHMMIAGLPPGTEIEIDPSHRFFLCQTEPCGQPSNSETRTFQNELFDSTLDLEMAGTGVLAGFRRDLSIPMAALTHTAHRTAGDPVQRFDTEMVNLTGSLPPGDPDFEQLQIVAGMANLPTSPSPGHTTLTDLGDGTFQVDSFFDIEYRISFVGAVGGPLDGMRGTTQATVRVEACDNPQCPTVVDVETQTVSTDKTILSAGLAKSSGQLNAQARLEIFAKHLTRLDNDFSAGGTGEVVIGTDSGIPCPIPAPTLEARTDGAPQELVLRPVAIIDG